MKKIDLLRVKKFTIYNKKSNQVLYETNEVYPQHFFPLSIIDFAYVIKESIKNKAAELPIMSISSKDYPQCDFNCKDCLAKTSRNWAKDNLSSVIPEIEKYKRILLNISNYSQKCGFDSVRFEICGEGNPDLYSGREEIIKYAKEKCNMGVVYISTGSKLNKKTKEALVKFASYIRISFPGIDNFSYDYYSNQKQKNKFGYQEALNLLKELIALRKEYKREDELIIGARTCIREPNEGKYITFAKELGKIGVDSLQIVKILTTEKEKIEKNELNERLKKELTTIYEQYEKYGLKHVQLPIKLDKIYNDRKLSNERKFSKCYSSILCPILYGTNLITCTHWDKITDIENYHYGVLNGTENEITTIINSQKSKNIRQKIPKNCNDCCSINDNTIFEIIENIVLSCDSLDDIEFKLE